MRAILLIHTGGTLGMAPSGEPTSLAPGPSLDLILEQVPELRQLAELKLVVAFNQDSSTNEPGDILRLAGLIRAESAGCRGVVLVHGTDTMAFTASMLGFLLAERIWASRWCSQAPSGPWPMFAAMLAAIWWMR